jgi:hypothetical protein
MSSLVWRVVAIVLGDIVGVAEVLACLNSSSMGDSLGDMLDMLSEVLEDILSVWGMQWGAECIASCHWCW